MPSTKRSIAQANGIGSDESPAEDEHRAPARAPRQHVSTDGRKPAKAKPPSSASDGSPAVDAGSLLILGLDSLSYLLRYLDVVSLARFEGACKQFRQMALPRWETLDGQIPAKGRSKAASPRLRVIRYHMDVNACKEIEPNIAEDVKYDEDADSRCHFPGSKYMLDTDVTSLGFEGNRHHDDELFCRFVQKSSGTLLAQGFCTAKSYSAFYKTRYFFFKDLDLSSWLAMKDLVGSLDRSTDLRTTLEKIMEDLSVVVLTISKEVCPEIYVASVANKVEDRDSLGRQGRRRWYSREMNTMLIRTGPYTFSRLKRIVTR